MAEIAEEVRQSLKQAFQEVAFRANRLREWLELDKTLRSLVVSFGDFHNEVKAIVGPPPNMNPASLARITDLWNRSRETDFIDLQAFSAGVKHINRSSAAEVAGAPEAGGMPRVNISTLVQLVESVEQSLANQAMNDLAQRCLQFQRTLRGQVADTQQIVRRELTELCEMTLQLKLQF
jgi:hypothetical protein